MAAGGLDGGRMSACAFREINEYAGGERRMPGGRQRDRAFKKEVEVKMSNNSLEQEIWQKVAALEEAFRAQEREYARAKYALNIAEIELKKAQGVRNRAQQKLSARQTELDGLHGLFTGRRRRELQASIESTSSDLKSAQAKVEAAEKGYAYAKSSMPKYPFSRDLTYESAAIYADAGMYIDAGREYNRIRGYRDVNAILANDARLSREATFAVGNTVTFGAYPQTGAGTDMTPIEWILLARDGQYALLLSKYALDDKPFHSKEEDVTWQKCALRKWLQKDFLNRAFSPEEQSAIRLSDVDNSRDQGYGKYEPIDGGNTRDRVFLLSYAEAWAYLSSYGDRICAPTDYVKEQIPDMYYTGNVGWWLRSPGGVKLQRGRWDGCQAQVVIYDGGINAHNVSHCLFVRPAL